MAMVEVVYTRVSFAVGYAVCGFMFLIFILDHLSLNAQDDAVEIME